MPHYASIKITEQAKQTYNYHREEGWSSSRDNVMNNIKLVKTKNHMS